MRATTGCKWCRLPCGSLMFPDYGMKHSYPADQTGFIPDSECDDGRPDPPGVHRWCPYCKESEDGDDA